jgi:glutaredoxin
MAKEFLDGKKIAYEHVDVSVDAGGRDELIKKSGQMGVPVIDVDGEIVIGFDRERLDALLGKAV